MTVLYVIPGVLLFRFASSLKRALQAPSAEAVAAALARQRVFWQIAVPLGLVMVFVGLVFTLPNVQQALNSVALG